MLQGRGVTAVAAVTALAVGLFLGLGALMVAWAAEDTTPQAMATRHHEPRAATTTLPATTTTVTTVAPAPPPLPEPEPAIEPPPTTAAVHVAGIAATQPEPVAEPAPAPEPDPAPAPAPAPAPPSPAPCPAPGGMLNTHNSIRCQNGLNQLGLDGAMSGNAQFHAERLMNAGACNSMYHAPEMASWYGGTWGENLACIFASGGCVNDPGRVIDGWMASPEHRANILNPNYSLIGAGYACDGQHAYFVVQYRG